MNNFNNRIIDKIRRIELRETRGRPKGKKFYPVSITLSEEQIDYLNNQPNASALIRKVLDDLIASGQPVQEKLGAVSLNMQLNELHKKEDELLSKRSYYIHENEDCWQHQPRAGYINPQIDWVNPEEDRCRGMPTPKPLDTEEAQIAFKVVQSYTEAIKSVRQQINEIKQKILSE